MLPSSELDQRIHQLLLQIPIQQQQLHSQTHTLTAALRVRLSSPASLAVAAVTGAFLGLWLQKRGSQIHLTLADTMGELFSIWHAQYPNTWFNLWRTLLSK